MPSGGQTLTFYVLALVLGVLGLTQTKLAEQLGVHWSTVARWEQGVRKISQPVARLVMLLNPPTRKKGRR